MGIGDDSRIGGLTEDGTQPGDRCNPTADQVAKHIPSANGWKLVHVPDKQDVRAGANGF